jgi:cell division protein FtsI (penicillin-binding protein 3)
MQEIVVPANRGAIYDASGNTIAESVSRYVIAIDQVTAKNWKALDCSEYSESQCHQIDGHPVGANGIIGLSRLLARPLGRAAQELAYELDGDSNYKIIGKDISPELKRQIDDLHIIGLVNATPVSSRIYHNGRAGSSEIGLALTEVDGTIKAHSGIEMMMDKELSGTAGARRFESGGSGERIPMTGFDETQPIDGLDVMSTIDLDVQWKLQQALQAEKDKNKSEFGIGVVERIHTGEIIAIGANDEPAAGTQEVGQSPSAALGTQFEPGSTVKTVTVSGLIESGIAEPESKYSVPDHFENQFGQVIKDWENHPTVTLTLAGIVGNSYNTGTTIASRNWGVDQRVNFYSNFGLGSSLWLHSADGTGFPGEALGYLWPADQLDGRTRDTILFGQGMAVTALQMVNAYASIANGGLNPVPTLISATRAKGESWTSYPKFETGEQLVSPTTAQKVMGILEACVAKSNCRSMAIPEYRIGGKTGTAEMYDNGSWTLVHSFIGVFPMDDPQYVVGMFYKGGNDIQTVTVTAPFFKEVAQFIIHKYGITPSVPGGYVPEIR